MKYLLVIVFIFPMLGSAQSKEPSEKLGRNPIYFIDSVRTTTSDFMHFDVNTIASLTILTDTDATNKYGQEAKDGVIWIQTKALATKRYLKFFRQKSAPFDSLYKVTNSDSTFVYIINDKIKGKNSSGDLATIDDYLFISLDVLTADDLKKKYNITDKQFGILIRSKKPQNLFNGDNKF